MHSVITHDKHGKQNRFLIRWKNWPEALATWISEAVFRADAPDMLAEYIPTAPVPRPRASSTRHRAGVGSATGSGSICLLCSPLL